MTTDRARETHPRQGEATFVEKPACGDCGGAIGTEVAAPGGVLTVKFIGLAIPEAALLAEAEAALRAALAPAGEGGT